MSYFTIRRLAPECWADPRPLTIALDPLRGPVVERQNLPHKVPHNDAVGLVIDPPIKVPHSELSDL